MSVMSAATAVGTKTQVKSLDAIRTGKQGAVLLAELQGLTLTGEVVEGGCTLDRLGR